MNASTGLPGSLLFLYSQAVFTGRFFFQLFSLPPDADRRPGAPLLGR